MTPRALRTHLLVVGGVLLVAGLVWLHVGLDTGTWGLFGGVVAFLHLGAFAAMVGWIAKRVRRHKEEAGVGE